MTVIELDVEIPDLASVEVETPNVEITPSGGDTVVLVVSPGPPGPQGPPGEGVVVMGEIPNGVINGVNKVFTTDFVFMTTSTGVFVNGLRQVRGPHYAETTSQSITFDEAPWVNDIVTIDYTVAG